MPALSMKMNCPVLLVNMAENVGLRRPTIQILFPLQNQPLKALTIIMRKERFEQNFTACSRLDNLRLVLETMIDHN